MALFQVIHFLAQHVLVYPVPYDWAVQDIWVRIQGLLGELQLREREHYHPQQLLPSMEERINILIKRENHENN